LICSWKIVCWWKIHKSDQPLARIVTFGAFPVCVAKDERRSALQWDYAAWTAGAGRFSEQLRKFAEKPPANKKLFVAISGQTSPRLRQELEKLGDGVKDRLSPGPLK
jgi:hypothetical protein